MPKLVTPIVDKGETFGFDKNSLAKIKDALKALSEAFETLNMQIGTLTGIQALHKTFSGTAAEKVAEHRLFYLCKGRECNSQYIL